jgi:hypothetical protein
MTDRQITCSFGYYNAYGLELLRKSNGSSTKVREAPLAGGVGCSSWKLIAKKT